MVMDAGSVSEDSSGTTFTPDPSLHVRSPKQTRSRDTLDRIRAAALELMAEHGVEGVTVRDVVDRAGSSVGSFYARFSGREQLVRYLRAHAREEVLEAWEAALQMPDVEELTLPERVEVLVAGLLDVAGGDESQALLLQDRKGPVQRRMRDDAVALLQAAAHQFPPFDAGARYAGLGWEMTVAAAGALLNRDEGGEPSLPPRQVRDALVRLLLGYLGAPVPEVQPAELTPEVQAAETMSEAQAAEPTRSTIPPKPRSDTESLDSPPPPALPEPEPEVDFVDPFDVWA